MRVFCEVTGNAAIDDNESLVGAGVDSYASVEFGSRLSEELGGVELPGSLVFDYPSVLDVAEYVGGLAGVKMG